jgi:flagella basal body P-ring formation protein FlgA
MRRIALALVVLLAALARLPAATAAGEALLKPAVVVHAEIVRLGDLFANLPPDKAALPAAYAPRPGERVVLDVERLVEITRAQGVSWIPRSRFERAVVERASRLIDREQIALALAPALGKSGLGKDDRIALDNENLRFYVPAESEAALQVRDLRYDPQSRRFSALIVADPSAVDSVFTVTGRVTRVVKLPVPVRALNREDVIGQRDIQWVQVSADRLDPNVITEEGQLVGMAPRHLLRAGDPVRTSDVQPPVVVSKGALVTMMYKTSFMVITARAKALQDGAKGETVRVMNLQSKRELEAVVASADMVVVQPATTFSMNTN